MSTEVVDILIVGGGPAGLTAALTVARQNHTAIVFDSGKYRNARADQMHMIPTWDGRDPAKFREEARNDIRQNYPAIQIKDIDLVSAEKINTEKANDSLFQVVDSEKNVYQGKKIILATGSGNIYPDIPGYEDAWTKRIFHCLFCHGYEDKGAPSTGVLGVQSGSIAPLAIHFAENAAQLSESVTIYTHGSEELASQLQTTLSTNKKFKVDTRVITRLSLEPKAIKLEFADGTSAIETFLVHNPFTQINGPFVEQLGIETTPSPIPGIGDIATNPPAGQTNVRGVFAAGDCITPYKVMPGAISSGCNAGVGASAQLVAENFGHPSMI